MTDRNEFPTPQRLADIRHEAELMRAEAIRASFVEFLNVIKRTFGAAKHALDIPKTEQL